MYNAELYIFFITEKRHHCVLWKRKGTAPHAAQEYKAMGLSPRERNGKAVLRGCRARSLSRTILPGLKNRAEPHEWTVLPDVLNRRSSGHR